MYIDFHTHAFADKIAGRAMEALSATSGLKPYTDGTLCGLKKKLRERDISAAVVLPIATKPSQQRVVNDWAADINGKNGIYSFGSVHPDADDAVQTLESIKASGLHGVKLHPDYQGSFVEDEKAFPIYQKCSELNLPITFHAGYDPLSPELIHGTPEGFLKVYESFPKLTMIIAHCGGMYRWDGVERLLAGKSGGIYFDVGFTAGEIGEKQLLRIIKKHGADRILLGSDCPWDDPENEINMIRRLPLSEEEKDMIFYKNALRLLKLEI